MNPSPSPDLIDSLQSFTPSTSGSSSSIINSNVHRYSRSTLIQLSNNSIAKKRPECALRTELMGLGVWKVNCGTGTNQQNGSRSGNDTVVAATSENISNNPPITVNMNPRGHRSPSARKNLSSVVWVKCESPSSHNGSHYTHPNQKNYIDHRSISSAHLMPAFAKRRIGVQQSGSVGSSGSSNPGRPVTPSDSNQVAKDVQYTSRQRGDRKNHPNERQQSSEQSSSSSYLSPQRENFGDYEKDHPTERVEVNLSSSASPASSALSSARQNASIPGNERRIGSGRLLHCDVNWDYRNTERDGVRNQTASDKEVPSHHYQQRNSARFTDRAGDRPGYIERRPYERRNNEIDREKFENRNNNLHTAPEQNPGQQVRARRHQYNDRNDEPEWFRGGPISQHDTIELRGFDEIEENYGNANKNSRRKLSESSSSHTSSNLNLSSMKSKDTQHCKGFNDEENETNLETINISTENSISTSTPSKEHLAVLSSRGDKNNNDGQKQSESDKSFLKLIEQQTDESVSNNKKHNTSINSNFTEFNFDAFLNMDPLNHSLMGADMKSDEDLEMIENSRFSRWFGNKNNQTDKLNPTVSNEPSNEAKLDDPLKTTGHIFKDLVSPNSNESQNIKQTNTLMQFLQRSRIPPSLNDVGQPQVVMPSVEELEARMHRIHSVGLNPESTVIEESQLNTSNKPLREGVKLQDSASESPVPAPSQDTEAFKKLLEQLGSANKQDQSHLNDTPQYYQDHQILNNTSTFLNMSSHASKNEELNKLTLQHELIQQQRQTQPCQQYLAQQMANESLQALDSQMSVFAAHKRIFLQSLSRGEVKIGSLEHELNNPNTSPYAKEIIAAVLREHSRSVIPPNCISHAASGGTHKLHSPTTINPGKQHSAQQQQSGVSNHGNFIANLQLPKTGILPLQPHGTLKPGFMLGNPRDLQSYSQIIRQNIDMNNKPESDEKYWKDIEMHERFLKAGIISRSIQMKINQKNLHHQLPESLDFLTPQQSSTPMQTSPQQQHGSHSIQQLQQRHINSPTPLAFTPTSVLRKMTAEKDNSTLVVSSPQQQTTSQIQASATMAQQRQLPHHQIGNKNMQTVSMNQQQQKQTPQQQTHQQVFISNVTSQPQTTQQQPRMILGGGNHQSQQLQLCNGGQQIMPQQHSLQQQQNLTSIHQTQQVQKMRNNQQLKWPLTPILNQQQQIPVAKPIGRPILKGPLPTATHSQPKQQQQQQMSPMSFASRIEFQQIQQQQKLKINPTLQHLQHHHHQQPQFPMAQQQPPQPSAMNHAVQQHLFQQQQQHRVAALQRAQHIHLQQFRQLQPQQLSRQTSLIGSNTTQSAQSTNATTGSSSGIINYQRDGGLSPTSNQLAQWFSPELLAQASAGKLPLLNMNQALSLEEFERSIQHSSTAVQN